MISSANWSKLQKKWALTYNPFAIKPDTNISHSSPYFDSHYM